MTIEYAIFGNGCFWCSEAVFKDVIGVESVESVYTGGHVANPTYEQVCGGETGHAEGIRIGFDPEKISYGELLDINFVTHDPTQLNRQGNDIGTQYRSVIFPLNAEQEVEAKAAIQRAQADNQQPVVTAIEPLGEVFVAENYHQNYWAGAGQENRYCLAVIPPKLQKLRKSFANRSKSLNS